MMPTMTKWPLSKRRLAPRVQVKVKSDSFQWWTERTFCTSYAAIRMGNLVIGRSRRAVPIVGRAGLAHASVLSRRYLAYGFDQMVMIVWPPARAHTEWYEPWPAGARGRHLIEPLRAYGSSPLRPVHMSDICGTAHWIVPAMKEALRWRREAAR